VDAAAGAGGSGGAFEDAAVLVPPPDAGGFVPPDAAASDLGLTPDLPPPPDASPSPAEPRRILPAGVDLLGLHRSTCSHQAPASGDGHRWCAISRPGDLLGKRDLWVFDATLVAGGAPLVCDGVNPVCKRLSSDLFSGQPDVGPAYPTAHRFYGDTLIFYADARSVPTALYQGPVYAWRPGWPAARAITTNVGVFCTGHPFTDVAVCLENISPPDAAVTQYDVHAGRVDGGPLPFVARVTPMRADTGDTQWRSGFTLDGSYFAYSTGGPTVSDAETLWVMRTEDIGATAKYLKVGTGLSRWTISADQKRWFFLRSFNYDTQGNPSGTLAMADFPAGGNEVTLLAKVGVFQELVDRSGKSGGLAVLDNVVAGLGTYEILHDPTRPAGEAGNLLTVANQVGSVPLVSPDLRHALFSRNLSPNSITSDFWVAHLDGAASCTITGTLGAALFGYPFTPSGGLVFWGDFYDTVTDTAQVMFASPASCGGKGKLADHVDFWFFAGDQGIVFSTIDGPRASLRHQRFQAGPPQALALGGPATVTTHADRLFALLPATDGVFFTVTEGGADDGLYFAPLPFGK
jgi:hypothetical protein